MTTPTNASKLLEERIRRALGESVAIQVVFEAETPVLKISASRIEAIERAVKAITALGEETAQIAQETHAGLDVLLAKRRELEGDDRERRDAATLLRDFLKDSELLAHNLDFMISSDPEELRRVLISAKKYLAPEKIEWLKEVLDAPVTD